MQTYFRNIEKMYLTQDLPITPNNIQTVLCDQDEIQWPLESIANSSSITREYLDRLTHIQATNGDKQSKPFQKIANKYQKMVLIASSKGDVVNTELNGGAMEFFNQSTLLLVQIFLNSFLEARDIECTVSTALASILMHGRFLWLDAANPSGLASSVILSKDIINSDTLYNGIVLDYLIKHEISDDYLNKLTKTKVMYPTEIEATIHWQDALAALSGLFFGETSYLAKGLDELVVECKRTRKCRPEQRKWRRSWGLMNEWVSEWVSEWMNEWMNEQ